MSKKAKAREHKLFQGPFGIIRETKLLEVIKFVSLEEFQQKRKAFLERILQFKKFFFLKHVSIAFDAQPLDYFLEENPSALIIAGMLLEINEKLNSATKKLIWEIIKNCRDQENMELDVNQNILLSNFHVTRELKHFLIGVTIYSGKPYLIYLRPIKETISIIPKRVRMEFIENHLFRGKILNEAQMAFLGIKDETQKIEAILTEIE